MSADQGDRIAQARRRTGLTQRAFALQINRSESLISKLEQGDRELNDLRLARAIAEFAGVRLAWLLGLDDGPVAEDAPIRACEDRSKAESATGEWSNLLRRTFVLGGLAASVSVGRIGKGAIAPEFIDDLSAVSATFRRAYSAAPAQQLYSAAHEHMRLVLSLHPAHRPADVRDRLLANVGEMAALSATILGINLGRWAEVGPYLDLAFNAARESRNADLETIVWACRAFQAAYGADNSRLPQNSRMSRSPQASRAQPR